MLIKNRIAILSYKKELNLPSVKWYLDFPGGFVRSIKFKDVQLSILLLYINQNAKYIH